MREAGWPPSSSRATRRLRQRWPQRISTLPACSRRVPSGACARAASSRSSTVTIVCCGRRWAAGPRACPSAMAAAARQSQSRPWPMVPLRRLAPRPHLAQWRRTRARARARARRRRRRAVTGGSRLWRTLRRCAVTLLRRRRSVPRRGCGRGSSGVPSRRAGGWPRAHASRTAPCTLRAHSTAYALHAHANPQARWHFYGGSGGESGAVVLARKEVARRAWRARGAPLSDAQAATLLATLRADPDLLRPGVCMHACMARECACACARACACFDPACSAQV